MKQSIGLFELIKSMTKLEKRHFKLFTAGYGDNSNYIRLFNAINKQNVYNEQKILAQFKDETFAKQLHVIKNYLYNLILKSMRSYHAEGGVNIKIRSLLDSYEILHNKKLYGHAEKVLLKAKKLAYEHECFAYALEISNIEESLVRNKYELEKLEEEYNSIYLDQKKLIKKITNRQEYQKLHNALTMLHKKSGKPRTSHDLALYKKILNHPLYRDVSEALSDSAVGSFYSSHILFNYLIGNRKKSLDFLSRQILFIGGDPQRKSRFLDDLLVIMGNRITISRRLLPYQQIEVFIDEFKSIHEHTLPKSEMAMTFYHLYKLDLLCSTGMFSQAANVAKEAERWISKNTFITAIGNADIRLYSKISYTYFGNKNYHKALFWLNKILNHPNKENIRMDLYCLLILYNLVLHYELKNTELLPYITKSTYRFLLSRKRLYKLESFIMEFIKRTLLEFKTKNEEKKAFKMFQEKLKPLQKDDFENQAFEYFDFVSWLDSKIDGISFEDAVKKNCAFV